MDRGSSEALFPFFAVYLCVALKLFFLDSKKFNICYLALQNYAVDRRPSPSRCEPGNDTSCLAGQAAAAPALESCPDMGRWNTWDRRWKHWDDRHSALYHTPGIIMNLISMLFVKDVYIWHYFVSASSISSTTIQFDLCNYFNKEWSSEESKTNGRDFSQFFIKSDLTHIYEGSLHHHTPYPSRFSYSTHIFKFITW